MSNFRGCPRDLASVVKGHQWYMLETKHVNAIWEVPIPWIIYYVLNHQNNALFALLKHNLACQLSAKEQRNNRDILMEALEQGLPVGWSFKAGQIEPCPPCPPHRQCANLQHVIHPHRDWRCSYRASFPPFPSSINLWKPMWKIAIQLGDSAPSHSSSVLPQYGM